MKYLRHLALVFLFTSSLCVMAQDIITTYSKINMTTILSLDWSSSNYGTIQWQSSLDGGTTWADISGATDKSYSFVPTAEMWLRVIVKGDEACKPIIKTYNVKVGTFSVNLVETGATTAIYEISGLTIPKDEIVEWGFCHNYYNLSRTYSNMYREAVGTTLPNGNTFNLICSNLMPNSKNTVRIYMKTKGGSIIYGPAKITETQPGLIWSTEDWNITKTSVTAKFKLAGYTGTTPTINFKFGTSGNMHSYVATVVDNIYSATITGLQPATDYIATVNADIEGDEQTITKTVRTWTDYSTYSVDKTITPVSHKIIWDRTNRIQLSPDNVQAEYPRFVRVSNDSILLTYHGGDGTAVNTDHWQDIYMQRSTDNGHTWSDPEKLMDHSKAYSNQSNGWNRFSDPTFTHLENGWILMQFVGNANPETNANCQVLISISKDGGVTWGDPITVGRGRTWEPQILQLPGGELELLVSSEAYWWDNQHDNLYQEILSSRSTDNGQTWTSFVRASYNPGKRDGMPVPIVLQGNKGVLFSIESINSNENPSLVYRTLDGEWDSSDWDGTYDINRWKAELISGSCAPFAIQLPTGEVVVMGHANQSGSVWQTCRSQVCIGDNTGHNFKNRTMPFSTMSYGEGAYYSSFFIKNVDTIWLAITHSVYDGTNSKKNTIEYIEGNIIEE